MSLFLLLSEISFALLILQLFLCFRVNSLWWKSLPVMLVGLADTVLWFLTVAFRTREISFGFFGLAFVGLEWLAGLGLGWLIFGIVRFIQNIRTNFGV